MTKRSTSAVAIVTCAVSLLLVAAWVFREGRQTVSEQQSSQFGHSPSDSEIMSVFRLYPKYDMPAGLFGEVTQDLLVSDHVTAELTANVLKMVVFVSGADGISAKERRFFLEMVTTATGNQLKKAAIIKLLNSRPSLRELSMNLRKIGMVDLQLYFTAITANADGFSEAEKKAFSDLCQSGAYNGARILDIVARETALQADLVSIMSSE